MYVQLAVVSLGRRVRDKHHFSLIIITIILLGLIHGPVLVTSASVHLRLPLHLAGSPSHKVLRHLRVWSKHKAAVLAKIRPPLTRRRDQLSC